MQRKIAIIICLLFIVNTDLYSYSYKSFNEVEEYQKFIKLRQGLLLKSTPSKVMNTMFAVSEYYFKHNDLSDAQREFSSFIKAYPPQITTLLANIYLYKIFNLRQKSEEANLLKKEIFQKSFILLFTDHEVLNYTSSFDNEYEIRYYIDKIQVFLNGEIFEEVSP